jgi:hypothetical protein
MLDVLTVLLGIVLVLFAAGSWSQWYFAQKYPWVKPESEPEPRYVRKAMEVVSHSGYTVMCTTV